VTFEEITQEFIAKNKEQILCQTMPISKKNGGPYSKQQLKKRRNEVYRLHFDHGCSARKISELMKINRNTINGDIKHWYSKVANSNDIQPESALFAILERLDIQRTRIREYLDNTSAISVVADNNWFATSVADSIILSELNNEPRSILL